MQVQSLLDYFEKKFPLENQEPWDNSGLQWGNTDHRLTGIVVALDFSSDVVTFAEKLHYNMIITHHPPIFKPLHSLDLKDPRINAIVRSLSLNQIVYSAHTNLDLGHGGVNDALSARLGLINTKAFGSPLFGRYGYIEPMDMDDFLAHVKTSLNVEALMFYGQADRIQKVGIAGGAGSDLIGSALDLQLDALITGDIKYHEGELAHRSGLLLVDAGHYETEFPVLQDVKRMLEEISKVDVCIAEIPKIRGFFS